MIVDSTDIQLEAGAEGKKIGKLTLSNISAAPVNVEATIRGDAGCSIEPSPTRIKSGRRTTVTLTFAKGCNVSDGADVTLSFGAGVKPPSQVVKVTDAPKTDPNWDILVWSFVIGVALGLAAVVVTAGRMVFQNLRRKESEVRFGGGTALPYLGTDWSFKDNWVGNVTIGSAALVALLAASDVLKTILGTEPEAALGLLAVASALAAVFVAIGPLFVKVIGEDVAVPTVGGMLTAALVTLTGTLGQITALTWQGAELTTGRVHWGVIALGVLTGFVVWSYATKALWDFAISGSKRPPRTTPDAVTAAKIVARAIREKGGAGEAIKDEELDRIEQEGMRISAEKRNALL